MHTTWTRRQHDTGVHYLHRVEAPQFCCTHMKTAWEDRAVGVRFGGEQIEILGQHGPPSSRSVTAQKTGESFKNEAASRQR